MASGIAFSSPRPSAKNIARAPLNASPAAVVSIGLTYPRFDSDWFQVFLGGMLLLAVLFNNFIRKKVTGER